MGHPVVPQTSHLCLPQAISQDLPPLEDPAILHPPTPALLLWVGDMLPSHTRPAYMYTWADTFDPTRWGSVLSLPLLCSDHFDSCMDCIL